MSIFAWLNGVWQSSRAGFLIPALVSGFRSRKLKILVLFETVTRSFPILI